MQVVSTPRNAGHASGATPRRERYVARCPHSPLFIDRRLVLSDGEHCLLAVLDPALNDTVDIENLKPNTLVRLDEFFCYIVGGRR